MKKIIDVSYSQPNIDYVATAKEIDGVIIRCGRTLWGRFVPGADGKWEKHYNGFKSAGVPIGAYYYGVAKNPAQAKQEAEQCIKLLEGKKLAYPIYYDVEEQNTQGSLTKEQLTEVVETFCKALEDAGYFAGFYTMLSWAQSKLDYASLAKQFTSWIAWTSGDPSAKLTPAPAGWQYSWKGSYDGISGDVDQNYFYQDFPTIIKSAGLNGYGESSPEPEPNNPAIHWDELRALLEAKGIETIVIK